MCKRFADLISRATLLHISGIALNGIDSFLSVRPVNQQGSIPSNILFGENTNE